jgi:N-acetylneuraminic acid mutarotase
MISPINDRQLALEQSEDAPSPRTGHSLVFDGGVGYLFGGASHEQGHLNSLYKFNIQDGQVIWTRINIYSTIDTPLERYEHFSILKDGKLIIGYGSGEQQCFNDCWVYDIDRNCWSELQVKGTKPSPRTARGYAFDACKNRVYFYGGGAINNAAVEDCALYCLDIEHAFWVRISTNGPRASLGHSMNIYKDKIYMLGGMDGTTCFDDLYCFDIKTRSWSRLTPKGSGPGPICGHTSTIVDNCLIVLGGMTILNPRLIKQAYKLNLGN